MAGPVDKTAGVQQSVVVGTSHDGSYTPKTEVALWVFALLFFITFLALTCLTIYLHLTR